MAHAASIALPPFVKIIEPAVALSGFPVIAIQCLAWSGGFCVRCASALSASMANPAMTNGMSECLIIVFGGGDCYFNLHAAPEIRQTRAGKALAFFSNRSSK
jgi:hypothetical protein